MSWFRIDDQAAFGAKLVEAGNEAVGAWARAGAWSSGALSDGFVPRHVALTIAPKRVWDRLRDARGGHEHGMVEERTDGWQLHNFTKRNPTAATVRAAREATNERVRNWRGNKVGNGVTKTVGNGVTKTVVTPPPSHPDPIPVHGDPPVVPQGTDPPKAKGDRRKPSRLLPADWTPGESHYRKAQSAGMSRSDVERAAERFRLHHGAKGSVFADWSLAFHTWLANDLDRRGPPMPERDDRPISVKHEEHRRRLEAQHGIDFAAIGRGGS